LTAEVIARRRKSGIRMAAGGIPGESNGLRNKKTTLLAAHVFAFPGLPHHNNFPLGRDTARTQGDEGWAAIHAAEARNDASQEARHRRRAAHPSSP
jgi:hypothetical protein